MGAIRTLVIDSAAGSDKVVEAGRTVCREEGTCHLAVGKRPNP
jgi:hypothetical protein